FSLKAGEPSTSVQEIADLVIVLMINHGYGVIKNIQDARYGGLNYYVDLHTPDFAELTYALNVAYQRVDSLQDIDSVLAEAMAGQGPQLVEIDMTAIGDFAETFAGPPRSEERHVG